MAEHMIEPALARDLEAQEAFAEMTATTVLEVQEPPVIRAAPPAEADPNREPARRALLAIGHACGLMPELTDGPGTTEAAAIQKLASDLRAGEPGRRVTMLRTRLDDTQRQLDEVKASLHSAEAAHFAALGEIDGGAIDVARNAVLAHSGKVQLLQSEVETLKGLAVKAQNDLNAAWQNGLANLWPVLGRQSEVEHQQAFGQLLEMVRRPEFKQLLAVLCRSARVGDWLGQMGHFSRRALLKEGLRV